MKIPRLNHSQLLRSGRAQICAAVLIAMGMALTGCENTRTAVPISDAVPSSLAASPAYIEGFAVQIQGVQHDNWTDTAGGPCTARQWGGEVAKVTSVEPALLTVFDVTSASGDLAGTAPVRLYLTVSRTASGCSRFKNHRFTHCGNMSFDATASLSYAHGRVSLSPQGIDPIINVPTARFDTECTDWAEMAFGLPITTFSLANTDHLLDKTSGSVSGPLAAKQLLNVSDPAPTVIMTGNAADHTSPGLRRSVDIFLTVRLKRLYSIHPWNRREIPNCEALRDLIAGTHNSSAGYNDYHLQWEQIKFSEISNRHGLETRREAVRLYIQNGQAGLLLPDWTNVTRPQDVVFWKKYMAEVLRYDSGPVSVLADFLKAHSRTYVVTAAGSASGTAADLLLLREDAKQKELEAQLSAAQARYANARCP